GHGRRGGLVTAGLGNRGTQPLNRVSHVARTTVGEDGFGGVVVDRGGEPVFGIGVEPFLGSTRLQIEKAGHQRTGKAEQRRRKRNSHAAKGGSKTPEERIEHRER